MSGIQKSHMIFATFWKLKSKVKMRGEKNEYFLMVSLVPEAGCVQTLKWYTGLDENYLVFPASDCSFRQITTQPLSENSCDNGCFIGYHKTRLKCSAQCLALKKLLLFLCLLSSYAKEHE